MGRGLLCDCETATFVREGSFSSSIKYPSRSRDGEHNVADITGDKLTHDQAEDRNCEDSCSLSRSSVEVFDETTMKLM